MSSNNLKKLISLFFLLFILASSTTSLSEESAKSEKKGLYLCNGVWTTTKCDSPESELPYHHHESNSSNDEIRKKNKKLDEILHPLRIKASDVYNTYGAYYDISVVEYSCFELSENISDCVDLTMKEHEKLLNYELSLRKQKNEEEQKQKRVEQERAELNIHHHYNRPLHFFPGYIYPGFGIFPPRPRPPIIVPPRPPNQAPTQVYPHIIPRPRPGQSLSIPGPR